MQHRGLAAVCAVWATLGMAIASMGLGAVNSDARLLVFAATVIGVGSALVAAVLLLWGHVRWAGLCLLISVVTPTWFAAALNLVPLVMGLLLVSGRWSASRSTRIKATTGHRPRTPPTRGTHMDLEISPKHDHSRDL